MSYRRPPAVLSLASLLCGAGALVPPSASATLGGSGEYAFALHTCPNSGSTDPGTDDPVHVTLQADGRLYRLELNNPGNDREPDQTDIQFFEWPSEIGGVSQLEQIKIEKSGSNDWCFDRFELIHHQDVIFRWRSSDPATTRNMVVDHPRSGRIWLDRPESRGSSHPAPYVRFTDAFVRGPGHEFYLGGSYLRVETCSATRGENVGTNAAVELAIMHDGVGDVFAIPANTFADGGSAHDIYVDNPSSSHGPLSALHTVDWVAVSKKDGSDWCVESVGWLAGTDGGLVYPREYTRMFGTSRHTLPTGRASKKWQLDDEIWEACTSCGQTFLGFPLRASSSWNQAAANCADAREVCDGRDNTCDGRTDEDLAVTTWYRDRDGDGFGIANDRQERCRAPEGFTRLSGDCNDNSNAIHPMMREVCDRVDNNCSGVVDEGVTNACGTCGGAPAEICDDRDNDCDGLLNEGLATIPEVCNGFDDNCNGLVDADDPAAVGLNACGACGPTPLEVCDGFDNDCDGAVDDHPSDVNACGVCGPLPAETCNARDDDCNGVVDDYAETRFCGAGVCQNTGTAICVEGEMRDLCTPLPPQGDDYDCNGLDDDCDGLVDEHFAPMAIECTGSCGMGELTCRNGQIINTCDACEG